MQFFRNTTNYDFMGKRQILLVVSGIVVLLSLILTLTVGPKYGIDFAGGTEIQVAFKKEVGPAEVRKTLAELGYPGSEVVSFGSQESEYLLRLKTISPVTEELEKSSRAAFEQRFSDSKVSKFSFSPGGEKLTIAMSKTVSIPELEKVVGASGLSLSAVANVVPKASENVESVTSDGAEVETSKSCESVTCTWPFRNDRIYVVNLKSVADQVMQGFRAKAYGEGAEKKRSEWVGPKVGKQLRDAGIYSLLYAILFIMIYIAVRFDLRFAPGAVVALIHDVIITVGIFTLVRIEVTLATVAALLTIVGYSLNDTIVVFDRIRENLHKIKERKLSLVINTSINQTLSRTVLTSVTTLLVVVSILTIGWRTTLRDFAFALLIGVLIGTYSSIFIASPIVVWLDKRFAKKKA
jgi:preprotein translocase subunit SecF